MIRFCVPYIALIAITHLQNGRIFSLADPDKNPVCTTPECQKLGTLYQQYMNVNGRPCSDFYDYVCHNWAIYNPRPKEISMQYLWNIGQNHYFKAWLEMKNYRYPINTQNEIGSELGLIWKLHPPVSISFAELLESPNTPTSRDFEQAKLLYKTCMDMPFLSKYKPKDVRNFMRNISAFPFLVPHNIALPPQPPIWEIDQRYMKLTGESALFDFKMQSSLTFPYERMTKLKAPSSAYGALYRHTTWRNPIELNNYKAFIEKGIRSLVEHDYPFTKELIQIQTDEVIRFREELLLSIRAEQNSKEKNDPVTIKQFQLWYNSRITPNSAAQINWLEMIRAMYKNSDDARSSKITENSKIKVRSYNYFAELANLLHLAPRRAIGKHDYYLQCYELFRHILELKSSEYTLKKYRTIPLFMVNVKKLKILKAPLNHIHLYFMERHLEFNSQMQTNLENSVKVNGADGSGEAAIGMYRWISCLENKVLKQLMGKTYVNSVFTKNDKSNVLEFFQKGKELLQQMIRESSWLNSKTIMSSIYKVKKITAAIGYPDWYDTDKLATPNTEDILPLKPDAFYDNELNHISVTAAYLQTPIYSRDVPYVIDYGSTFNVFAHELYHAFDTDGIVYDENGNGPWWTPDMVKLHQKRTKCFTDQFAQYKADEYQKIKGHAPQQFKFGSTLDEDTSDVMGLKLSYLGYKEMLKKNKGVCPVLPGFETFGCEKLFFIAFANTFCTDNITEQQEVQLMNGLYSLSQTRVNGAVANMKEFSTAFGCKPMDPKRTCDLWK